MTNEELKHAGGVMVAAASGAAIQVSGDSGMNWVDCRSEPSWDWASYTYRIKPPKTLRPWKPEEVPVDAWYRTGLDAGLWFKVCQFNAINGTITNYDDDGWTPGEALAGLSHSTDGGKAWLRCGVEVDA